VSDDGAADPRLAAALAAHEAHEAHKAHKAHKAHTGSTATHAEVLAALATARLFVAITATSTAEHIEHSTGLRAESSAEMALVSLVSATGTRALPAFADLASMRRWRLDVRPVPVDATYLCQAALDDGAVAVVLDPAGAHLVLDRAEVEALAAGYVPVPGSALSARRTTEQLTHPASDPHPELINALAAALKPERLRGARLLEGSAGPVLGVVPRRPMNPAELAALAARVVQRLGPALPVDGLDLAVVPPKGPGVEVRPGR